MMAEDKEIATETETELAAAREIADMISDFREEVMDKVRTDIEKEVAEVEASGFDPARGRGRGPLWADGG
jgi:hypothetical protein